MPKDTVKWELPPELEEAYPKHLRPKRVAKNRLEHTSPFNEWPGTITTPVYLDAADYEQWWLQVNKEEDDENEKHWAFNDWKSRYHLIKQWSMEDMDLEELQPDPTKLPDTRLIIWVVTVLQPIITFSTSLPNWRGPLSGTTTQNEKPDTANETSEQ